MAALFQKAAAKSKSKAAAKKSEGTFWVVDGDAAESVGELVKIADEQKAIDTRTGIHKRAVQTYADEIFSREFAARGVMPDTPMKIVNDDGASVTYVVQDRSGQYGISDAQMAQLVGIVGQEKAENMTHSEMTIKFNRDVMALPGVSRFVERCLEAAIKRMVKDEILTEDAASELVDVDEKVAFKPGTLSKASMIAEGDQAVLNELLEVMGSSCCRYVKT